MASIEIGSYLRPSDQRNSLGTFGLDAVRGIATSKAFIPTKANMKGVSLTGYKVVNPGEIAFVPDTSRRGDKISLAQNVEKTPVLVSSISTVFSCDRNSLLPEYLMLFLSRPEFDRYARFHSWGSARETFNWDDMCSITLDLPRVEDQQRYVDLHNGILTSLAEQETIATATRSAFEASVERIRSTYSYSKIGAHIIPTDKRNKGGELALEALRGISIDKVLIPTKANMKGVSLTSYKVVRPGAIAFVPVTSRNGNKISIAINNTNTDVLVSSINQVFECDSSTLLPEYLMLFLSRSQFDRYARFHSWGSARETFNWDDMRDVMIPVPPIDVQESVTALSHAHFASTNAATRTRELLKDLCPVLIRGSLDEARREEVSA